MKQSLERVVKFFAYRIFVLYFTWASASNEARAEEQYALLFNGANLNGWINENNAHKVKNGVITCVKGSVGKLLTEEEFSDFELQFEFRLSTGGNSGVAIRAPKDGDAAYEGLELQILDNDAEKYAALEEYQYHGSLYGVAPAKRGYLKPVGTWNQQKVTVKDRNIRVCLNGVLILDVNIDRVSPGGKTIDHKDHPGLARKTGHVGFLGHGDKVAFRKVMIRKLNVLDSQK